jgi:hypothetical protein
MLSSTPFNRQPKKERMNMMTYDQFVKFVKAHRSRMEEVIPIPTDTGEGAVRVWHHEVAVVVSLLDAELIPFSFVEDLIKEELTEALADGALPVYHTLMSIKCDQAPTQESDRTGTFVGA